jgi:hypothetical protein
MQKKKKRSEVYNAAEMQNKGDVGYNPTEWTYKNLHEIVEIIETVSPKGPKMAKNLPQI